MDVFVNPQDLRAFASYLDEMSSQFKDQRMGIMGAFANLAASWKLDARFPAFEKGFLGSMEGPEQFLQECEEFTEYLWKLAAIAEEIQAQDYSSEW